MEEKEDKGFVVKDRRKVSLEDLDQEPAARESQPQPEEQPAQKEQAAGGAAKESSRQHDESSSPMPEVNFSTFVFSLSSSALVHLGEIPDPDSQRPQVDLPLAKQIIDTLGMLHDKTKGNLDQDEDRMLKNLLHDLRLRYVQKSGR